MIKNLPKYLKSSILFLFKTILGFLFLLLLYIISAFSLSKITFNKEHNTKEELSIYILTNGVHTDIVVPVKTEIFDWSNELKFSNTISKDSNFKYVAFGWGDKGFYLETPEWKDLKVSVAFKAAFALGNTAIHTTFYNSMYESENCKRIAISTKQYQRLINFINNSFQKDSNGHFINIDTKAVYGDNDAFYEARGSYSFFNTCNTWTNSALKVSGQKCCFWTPFDKGIFSAYK